MGRVVVSFDRNAPGEEIRCRASAAQLIVNRVYLRAHLDVRIDGWAEQRLRSYLASIDRIDAVGRLDWNNRPSSSAHEKVGHLFVEAVDMALAEDIEALADAGYRARAAESVSGPLALVKPNIELPSDVVRKLQEWAVRSAADETARRVAAGGELTKVEPKDIADELGTALLAALASAVEPERTYEVFGGRTSGYVVADSPQLAAQEWNKAHPGDDARWMHTPSGARVAPDGSPTY